MKNNCLGHGSFGWTRLASPVALKPVAGVVLLFGGIGA